MKNETYTENMACFNCDHEFIQEFPKGLTCDGYHDCPRCGCTKAMRVKQVKEDYQKFNQIVGI